MATDLLVLLVLVFTCCLSSCFSESRKELRIKLENVIQLAHALPPNTIDPSQVNELSWQPRVFMYKGFLSDEECDHLISLGNDNKEKLSGNNSTNLDISLEIEDEIIARIEERISAWTFLPKGNGKPFHILHIGSEEMKENQKYMSNMSMLPGESLHATLVMHLSNTTHGGHIIFPKAESGSWRVKSKITSDCSKKSSEITKPVKGNAILFFNVHPNSSLDPRGLHARCPVVKGDMWWATKIFVVKKPNSKTLKSNGDDDDLCTDEDENCPQWAAFGECERNPIYMIGTTDYYGTCRKSCNVC